MERHELLDTSITYLGKTYNTTIRKELTDDEYTGIVEGILSKPSIDDVKEQMKSVSSGGTRIDKIYSYFVKDIAYKTRLVYNNWSIDEALKYKPLMEFFAGKVNDNKKVFPDTMPLWKKVETAFRLCGFKTCSKPSNFPIKAIDGFLEKYGKKGDNYLDYSCGWGVRLLSSLRNGVNYFGMDPNNELVPRLEGMASLYREVNKCDTGYDIRCTGSEVLQEDWIDKIDIAFTSPPYFNLEDYRIGEKQSYHEGASYDSWVVNYVKPTVENCFRYCRNGAIFGYNIKNNFKYIKHDMEADWMKIAVDTGFTHIDTLPVTNITRVSGHKHVDSENTMLKHDNDEVIQIFRKI